MRAGRRTIVLTAVLLVAMQSAALASHFRYGNNSWKPGAGTNEIELQVSEGWRWSAFGNPAVGTVSPSDNTLEFGDGTFTSFSLLVTSVDAANDWFYGVALDPNRPAGNTSDTLINHTYPAPGDYVVATTSCCRIGQISGGNWHVNNPDGSQRVETVVNVGGTNASPVSTMPPIVLCPINGTCTFSVPASDPNSDGLRYRLSTSAEAGGFTQPGTPHATNAAAIDPTTGVYTWDTNGATLAPAGSTTLYSTQVTIEDLDAAGAVRSKTAVDFLIQLTTQVGSAPVFDQPPSPVCGSTLNTPIGAPLTFTVQASDADVADTITLNGVGIPAGATMNPVLPATGNPVSSQFSWTPTAAQAGNHVLTFSASDGTGQQALCSYSIVVGGVQPPGDDEILSGLKYYDANANGRHDAGEPGIEGWVVDVDDGGAVTPVATDADGEFSLDVAPGTFTVAERQAAGWIQTGNTVDQSGGTGEVTLNADKTYSVDLGAGETASGLNFGNLCLGAGGGRTIGFWGNKNGRALFSTDTAGALALLQGLNLRNEDGTPFNPTSWSQLERWLKGARAVNQAYMLSAQLAAMALDVHFGLVDPDALILAVGSASANPAGFATVADIVAEADAALAADGTTPAGDPDRALQKTLSDILDAANSNRTFVQSGPDDCPTPEFPV
ncbi:MAG: SdrD B-like domain-containing protein [Actinomycetota bacterium]